MFLPLTEAWWINLGWRQSQQYVCFGVNTWWQWVVNSCSECPSWCGMDCCTHCQGICVSSCSLQVICVSGLVFLLPKLERKLQNYLFYFFLWLS